MRTSTFSPTLAKTGGKVNRKAIVLYINILFLNLKTQKK
jgi:hypothetical protein